MAQEILVSKKVLTKKVLNESDQAMKIAIPNIFETAYAKYEVTKKEEEFIVVTH